MSPPLEDLRERADRCSRYEPIIGSYECIRLEASLKLKGAIVRPSHAARLGVLLELVTECEVLQGEVSAGANACHEGPEE